MPQYQQQKKGQARIRVLGKDATRAYMLLMQKTGGKLQVWPGDVFVVDEPLVTYVQENRIEFETIDQQ